ncbi:hypothetical protein KDL01_12670 [Actinospica durhamensis]|uniref:Uncharacterized protein n=1 Tax=Actinospica durhamensis TaxID=1508375 RepID=A0A941ELZ6_9ACTN|nr:hypothetical protein [Actinospica durhamensis]MBR7834122.1 hypothetical protein [Actinospica durhamensis]
MRGAQLAALLEQAPAGVPEALDLVSGFDDLLEHGLARIGQGRAGALAAIAGALEGTPLGSPAHEAVAKLSAGSVSREHLVTLAGARAALLGAAHDALLEHCDAALERTRGAWNQSPSAAVGTGPGEAVQAWLQELAVTGWRGLDQGHVDGADRLVEALLADPGGRRLAVLLDGLAAELRASVPIGPAACVPTRRWADLWSRAMLLARQATNGAGDTEPVTGRLLPLGVDVLEHGTAVQVLVYGVLETPTGTPRLVRTGVTAAKTDTISGPAVWRLLTAFPLLLTALAQQRSLELRDVALTADGRLLWDEARAALGEVADPFATARVLLPGVLAPAAAPLDRHPVALNEPVLVEGYKTAGGSWTVDGRNLRIEVDRLPATGPLTPALLKASTACIGVLRHDGSGWLLRPLAVQAKSKNSSTAYHGGDWALGPTDPKVVKAESKSGDPVAVLRERAGRLLRR